MKSESRIGWILNAMLMIAHGAHGQSTCESSIESTLFPVILAAGNGGVGSSLALDASGATIAIGSSFYEYGAIAAGAVVTLSQSATGNHQVDLFSPLQPQHQMFFGAAVALSAVGNTLAVGAPAGSGVLGRVFVYRKSSTGWQLELQHVGVGGDLLGSAVVLSDDGGTFVVGAPLRQGAWGSRGAVLTFRRLASGWMLESTITSADLPQSHIIGNVLAMSTDGQVLAIRSFASSNEPITSGAVYMMRRTTTGWVQEARLQEPVSYSDCCFGMSLALDATGETLVAGNYSDHRAGNLAGAVTVFRYGATGWGYETSFTSPAPVANGHFGISVAVNDAGDRLLVGTPNARLGGVNVGAVEEFIALSSAWSHIATHHARVLTSVGGFGRHLAMNATGSKWTTNEPGADMYGTNRGLVHVFEAPCLNPSVYCTAQTNTLGCAAQIAAQGTPSASSSSGFRISASNVRNQQNGMLLYGTSGRAAIPWLGGTLCVQPPLRRTPVVSSGGSAATANDCSGVLLRDFNAWGAGANDPELFAGQHVRAQFYSRDPGAPQNLNLTDAVEFYLEP
jgi:hypothetical protein